MPLRMEIHMPFLILFGSEVAGVMETTLYRLLYLQLLGAFDRPRRPLVGLIQTAIFADTSAKSQLGDSPDSVWRIRLVALKRRSCASLRDRPIPRLLFDENSNLPRTWTALRCVFHHGI